MDIFSILLIILIGLILPLLPKEK